MENEDRKRPTEKFEDLKTFLDVDNVQTLKTTYGSFSSSTSETFETMGKIKKNKKYFPYGLTEG